MRRATELRDLWEYNNMISIHALHEESDLGSMWGNLNLPISIHALHEESDPCFVSTEHGMSFQSTLSMRRATRSA